MKTQDRFVFSAKGGLVPVSDVLEIVSIADKLRVGSVEIGERQTLILSSPEGTPGLSNVLWTAEDEAYPNVMSSAGCEKLFSIESSWLTQGHYQDVFSTIERAPFLSVSIVNPYQSLVPRFVSQLNFVASGILNAWYLFLHLDGEEKLWPQLVYTSDVGRLIQNIEDHWIAGLRGKELVEETILSAPWKQTQNAPHPQFPRVAFPYFEGMNRLGDETWLGIFSRAGEYKSELIHDAAKLCQETKIGSIFLTPWRSILIRGIEEKDRIRWEKLLGLHGINTRHAALELGWTHKDGDHDALRLRNRLVRDLYASDARTFGLSFDISAFLDRRGASVQIVKSASLFPRYEIWYKENFDANSPRSIRFGKPQGANKLADQILKLYRVYVAVLHNIQRAQTGEKLTAEKASAVQENSEVWECPDCLSVYDPSYGDVKNRVGVGVDFPLVQNEYRCPVCQTPGAEFVLKKTLASVS